MRGLRRCCVRFTCLPPVILVKTNKRVRLVKRLAVTDMRMNYLKGDTINCVLAMLKFMFNISRIEMGQRKYINRRIVSVQTVNILRVTFFYTFTSSFLVMLVPLIRPYYIEVR